MKEVLELDALSKKVENLHIALEKKDKKIKNQATEITALIKAKKETETFYRDCLQEQTDEYMKVVRQLHDLKAIGDIQHNNHERQMDYAKNEIERLNVIINFLKGELYDL